MKQYNLFCIKFLLLFFLTYSTSFVARNPFSFADSPHVKKKMNVRLFGICQDDGQMIGLFECEQDFCVASVGQTVGPFTVAKITNTYADLEADNESFRVRLD